MVDFQHGEIKDIIPYNLISPETRALSFALGEAQRKLIRFTTATHLYAEAGLVPEPVLDLMALELNTQYYEQSLPRSVKERLVMQTLGWYMCAGTPSVLSGFLGTVLEGGDVEEWYEYGGEPYHFRAYAYTGDNEIQLGYGTEVKQRIETYKNVRSWMDYFMFIISMRYQMRIDHRYAMKIHIESYPWEAIPLKLNRKWKLSGSRRLGKYERDINRYPVGLKTILQTQYKLNGKGQMCLTLGTKIDPHIEASAKYGIHAELQTSVQTAIMISVRSEVHSGTGDVRIMVINRLDQKWKLNGTKKLNGGLYLK